MMIFTVTSTLGVSKESLAVTDTVPKPTTVWIKSAVVPGWGQLVNKQAWKLPVIYGTLGGVTWFALHQHQLYTDYRAAYYNSVPWRSDFRYGPTHPDLQGMPPEQILYNRNSYRNRRDLSIIVFVAAWGLNAIDAYVFAHLRDFDTGPDLSVIPSIYQHPFVLNTVSSAELKLTFPFSVR